MKSIQLGNHLMSEQLHEIENCKRIARKSQKILRDKPMPQKSHQQGHRYKRQVSQSLIGNMPGSLFTV
jgi:hypothetical protein